MCIHEASWSRMTRPRDASKGGEHTVYPRGFVEYYEEASWDGKRGSIKAEATYVMELNGEPTSKNRICIVAEGIQ